MDETTEMSVCGKADFKVKGMCQHFGSLAGLLSRQEFDQTLSHVRPSVNLEPAGEIFNTGIGSKGKRLV